jgi:dihydroflavonol-4-reductase
MIKLTLLKVLYFSSIAAIAGDDYKDNYFYTESDWGNSSIASPYTKSKILAEKAAWQFLEERKKANLKVFELTVINPGFIIGPVIHGKFSASEEPFKRLLNREMPLLPDIAIPLCKR